MNKKIDPTVTIVLTACAQGLSLLVGLVPLLSLLAIPLAILATVFACILHFRVWSAVPASARSTTPGKAVGFLFIPFFNFYWYFPSFVGLAESIEKATGKPSARGLAVAHAVMSVLQWIIIWIPIIGSLFTIASFVIWLMFVRAVVNDVNMRILITPAATNLPPMVSVPPPIASA